MRPSCRLTALLAVAPLLALGACTGSSSPAAGELEIVVSAPLSTSPWVGTFIRQGAQLGVDEVNEAGGVSTSAGNVRLRLTAVDNAGSASEVVAAGRRAVADGAAAMLVDGVGATALAAVTDPASLPVFVTFDGGESFIDPQARPTLFRMAPANRPMARRLADYLADQVQQVAFVTDDSGYGADGRQALADGFAVNKIPVVADEVVPAGAGDVSAQVRRARASGADHLVVWGGARTVTAVVTAARSAGWDVPVYTSPTGEDPLVRQQLAGHPDWVDGLAFVSFRMTAEVGPEPFEAYRSAYEEKFGVDEVGVQQDGADVVMPPDWSMYGYDSVKLLAAALETSGGATGAPLMDALTRTVITGANGDERGFSESDREGVSPDDMYFGRFDRFVFEPVTDDLLSTNLPAVPQT